MSGRKPDISVKIKPVSGGSTVSLGAFWRENGRIQGGWDKRVKRVYVLVDDGRGGEARIDITKADGKWSHYLNAYEETGAPPARAPAQKPKEAAPPDFDDDDIPFDLARQAG